LSNTANNHYRQGTNNHYRQGTKLLVPNFRTRLLSTIAEASAALRAAVDRLSSALARARQPGKPLATISAVTREAPLASLLVAFMLGMAMRRRR
jgi:hypothetical protein